MFGHIIMPALLAITISTLILRIVIGYLVKPPRIRNASKRFTMFDPRRLGRGAARLIYGRKPKRWNQCSSPKFLGLPSEAMVRRLTFASPSPTGKADTDTFKLRHLEPRCLKSEISFRLRSAHQELSSGFDFSRAFVGKIFELSSAIVKPGRGKTTWKRYWRPNRDEEARMR